MAAVSKSLLCLATSTMLSSLVQVSGTPALRHAGSPLSPLQPLGNLRTSPPVYSLYYPQPLLVWIITLTTLKTHSHLEVLKHFSACKTRQVLASKIPRFWMGLIQLASAFGAGRSFAKENSKACSIKVHKNSSTIPFVALWSARPHKNLMNLELPVCQRSLFFQ